MLHCLQQALGKLKPTAAVLAVVLWVGLFLFEIARTAPSVGCFGSEYQGCT